ncbi:UNVERIFIED_CONTAM: hypothetical protein PYX00_002505 [Menopon gallinae]|uniref:Tubulin-specific chaperone A n=1 Tax=Menopon gallinae TaxID=328185 RepID=A0AAW2IIZ4_9NEOP
MADPRLKQIKIKTGIVKRIAKEKVCYDNEANELRARIQKMKDECKEDYVIKKQEEILQESLMMVPDCQRRLEKAYEELKNILRDEKDLQETDEYSLAKKALEDAQPMLPNPGELLHFC